MQQVVLDPVVAESVIIALCEGAENCGYDVESIWYQPVTDCYKAVIGYDPISEGWSLADTCDILREYMAELVAMVQP